TKQFGVRPDCVAGHSLGEITAAHLAGILTLPDTALLVTTRARLMDTLPTTGAMTALQATPDEVHPLLEEHAGQVSIAAVNSPTSLVISGDHDTVEAVTAHFQDMGRKTTALQTSGAFHSPHLDTLLPELTATAETLTYQPPRIPLITTADPAEALTPHYWAHQARHHVDYQQITHNLHTHGTTTYL
ncbi:acyltransferase domain-containing protein, partial [Streptomyces stramineus]